MAQRSVAVVDYGMGNLRSVFQAVRHVADGAFDVVVTDSPQVVNDAQRVVLPGQGAMPDCMAALDQSGLRDAVMRAAAEKPLFGVCVGMQMLLEHSDEGSVPSLGLIPGAVHRFDLEGRVQADGSRFKVPQMGWNRVFYGHPKPHALFDGVADGTYYYFVHSYYAQPESTQHAAAYADFGGIFCAALAKDNLFATQFHPEKSADQGLARYRHFLHWNP